MYANANELRRILSGMIDTKRKGPSAAGERTQYDTAMRLGVSQGTISLFLSGREPRPARKLLIGLGFDPEPYWKRK